MSGELKFYYDNGNWIRRDIAVDVIVNTPSKVQNHPAESAQFGSALRQNEIIDAINSLPAVSVGTGDLINGRDLLSSQHTDLCYGIACKDCSMCTEDGGCRVEEWIDKFPSADRPQGKWKRGIVDYGFNADWKCSECGYKVFTDFVGFNYCPNCGCRMKGAEDDK